MTNPIGWCTKTWNPMTGCTPVSEACEHCYAAAAAHLHKARWGYDTPLFHENRLDVPLHWRRPQRIFICSMSDLFHEAFTDEQRDKVFATVAACQQHTFMVLTKRPEKMREYVSLVDGVWPLPNLWLGVTVENQQRADERIPVLLDTPAAVRFVSMEPLLGPVVETSGPRIAHEGWRWAWLDWVILGGENGPGARPMQPEWVRDVCRQCKAAEVPFWFKGVGSWWRRHDAWRSAQDAAIAEVRELPAVTP